MPGASAARRREIVMHGCQQQQTQCCVLVRGETATSMREGVTPPVACMQRQGGAPAAPYCKHRHCWQRQQVPHAPPAETTHEHSRQKKAPSRRTHISHTTRHGHRV